jgi:hypothetical protein
MAAQQTRALDKRREILYLTVAPAVTGGLSFLLWLLTPLPGAGSMPAALFIIATAQVAGIAITRVDRPAELSRPWLIDLAASLGLLPLLAIQVALLREPYVSLKGGSALPAIVATVVVVTFTFIVAAWSAFRFWKRPDECGLVYLPVALLIPQAMGQRTEMGIGQALAILSLAMLLGAAATSISAPLGVGVRLLVPPFTLGIEIALLWAAGRGPVFHPTSGGIVRLLYITMQATAVVTVVFVPVVAVWLRRWAPPYASFLSTSSRA